MGALAWGPRLRTPEPAGTRRCPSPDEYGHCPIPAGAAAVTAYVERRRTGRARGGPKALDAVRRCAPGFRPSMVRKGRSFLRSCGWAPPVGRLDVARARRSHGQRPAVRVALRSAPAATGRRTVRTAVSVRGARSTSPGVRGPGGDLPEPVGRALAHAARSRSVAAHEQRVAARYRCEDPFDVLDAPCRADTWPRS